MCNGNASNGIWTVIFLIAIKNDRNLKTWKEGVKQIISEKSIVSGKKLY